MPHIIFFDSVPFVLMNKLRNKEILEKFGIHIRNIRTKKQMTMEELAFACEVEYSQISRIERGKINATLTTLDALAKGLEITMEELLHNFNS